MSVNTGGFFFSNPTSAHLPAAVARGGDDETGRGAGQAVGVNGFDAGGAGGTRNFNAGMGVGCQQHQQLANNVHATGNGIPNPLAGMYGGVNQMNMNANVNQMNANVVNNPLQNVNNSGLGSFFFNPLAFFTTNSNQPIASSNNTVNNPLVNNPLVNGPLVNNPLVNNPLVNNPLAGGNGGVSDNGLGAMSALAANFLDASAALNGGNNIVSASAILNGSAPINNSQNIINGNALMNGGGLGIHSRQNQQNNQRQFTQLAAMQATTATSPAMLPNNNTRTRATTGVPSPAPMAFLTPLTTPNPTPPPAEGKLSNPPEMFLDANSFPPSRSASAVGEGDDSNHAETRVEDQAAAPMETNDTPIVTLQDSRQQQQQATDANSKSFFRRGISSMGSALAGVATYVNQSFISGIPFHIADRAMKESKLTYAKWWEDGINDNAEGGKKRKGSTDEEDNNDSDEDEQGGASRKRRRLDPPAVANINDAAGSALSKLLKKHYDDMGVDTSSGFVEYRQQLSQPPPPEPVSAPEVDSSIIAPRRNQLGIVTSPAGRVGGGYDAFNNIGDMYDFGDGGQRDDSVGGDGGRGIDSMYDSLGSYFTTDEGVEGDGDHDNHNATATSAAIDSTTPHAEGNPATAAATPLEDVDDDAPAPLLDGTMRAVQELLEEKDRASEENEILQMICSPRDWVKRSVRSELIDALQAAQGDVKDKRFLSSLEVLGNFYKTSGRDARASPWGSGRRAGDVVGGGDAYGYVGDEAGGPASSDLLEGCWVNMSRPNYVECLGRNSENDFLYTLGRMSFDMFRPGNLVCSVQSTHNTIKIVGEREELPASVPSSLREEVASLCNSARAGGGDGKGATKRPLLRSYDIAVSLTIERPESVGQPKPPATPTPTKRMRAVLAVKGYVLPDPETPNRLTVWFTGGKLSPARLASNGDETDDEDQADYDHQSTATNKAETDPNDEYGGFENWKAMFAKGKWRKTLGERARAMAAKLLLGADVPNKMEEDGHMEYVLHRPVGGHGKVYVDVLYLDEDILIMRGHHGTIYAMARSGVSQRYRAIRGGGGP